MAIKHVKENKQANETKQASAKHVDVYSYDELVAEYKAFGVPQECVMAALKFNNITHCDFETAKNIINKFMRRVIV